jgi:hypothetical protein
MKIVINRRLIPLLISTVLLTSVTGSALATTSAISIESRGFLTDSQSESVSKYLSQIIGDINNARSDLKNKQPVKANNLLVQAQKSMKSITSHYGTGTASVFISAMHTNIRRSDGLIAAENNPGMKSLDQLEKAKIALKEGQFDAAMKTVDSVEYPLVFASIDIPLPKIQADIDSAIRSIKTGNMDKAEQVLAINQDTVTTSSGVFDGTFKTKLAQLLVQLLKT